MAFGRFQPFSALSDVVLVPCFEAKSEKEVSFVRMTEETFFGAAGIGSSTLGGAGADATSFLTVATFGSAILREDVGWEEATVFFEAALRVRAGVDDFLGAETGVERWLTGAADLVLLRLREAI